MGRITASQFKDKIRKHYRKPCCLGDQVVPESLLEALEGLLGNNSLLRDCTENDDVMETMLSLCGINVDDEEAMHEVENTFNAIWLRDMGVSTHEINIKKEDGHFTFTHKIRTGKTETGGYTKVLEHVFETDAPGAVMNLISKLGIRPDSRPQALLWKWISEKEDK